MSLIDTPRANRLHIGIFGKRNSGKSSLLNALTGQDIALVSDVAGTTTDPVYKAMEIYGIGPCVFIDTAGFDDVGELGKMRVEKTKMAAEKTDIALVVFSGDDLDEEKKWIDMLKSRGTPVVLVLNKVDILAGAEEIAEKIEKEYGLKPILVSTREKVGIEKVHAAIIELLPEGYEVKSITGRLAGEGDLVLLVMPQDIQAPKGRLILPQMQTLRDLLDKKCVVVSATTDMLDQALKGLVKPPELIITDSQVFKTVYDKKPEGSKLTSFSILFANYKGDLDYYVKSVEAIDNLTEDSKVLIAEACTHVPLEEDIGREKLPRMLRKRIGEKLTVEVVSGQDFPEDLSGYDLVIQCGACMFNRKHVLSRIERARSQGVPMSNYGVVIAYLTGILDKIDLQI
ncbi:[FeFe] hydrogenase H-cluster maturation GTPase HydF [Clostridium thermosuccinogenes]|jgi:[FeFe] hydrogenase H-cluster maturation GTPase HydF|uniref:[FeFe] hydrogenase H-cluster maturation GTPase HydF n=1 Tax=Clostridium thermosuccinogenes TaxID=84032 RepID=UPI000CCC256F|nr:[FeFe] hydrogenase H-cluster maturation GTPase HydF [Pseudoclostridium thermosuccinogenes]PNT90470.1 [FeFe] hydrogenase H-cluster maturation GTPase HydF [Pseudoclostridium thermosuccinogenes]